MAHSASAQKRIRQNEKKRIYNKSIKSEIKTRSKRLAEAVEAGDAEKSKEIFRLVVSRIDKARKSKILHRNKASRLESKLARLLNQVGS